MIDLAFSVALLVCVFTVLALGGRYLLIVIEKERPKKIEPPRAWGELPVVKITGGDDDTRHVESRRIVIDNDRQIETRLYHDGEVIESARHNARDQAVRYHDGLVKRNGVDENKGARPEWDAIRPDSVLDARRPHRRELELPGDPFA